MYMHGTEKRNHQTTSYCWGPAAFKWHPGCWNKDLTRCIEDTEAYTRREHIINRGLPEGSFSEMATRSQGDDATDQPESSAAVEQTVFRFCREQLHIEVCEKDI